MIELLKSILWACMLMLMLAFFAMVSCFIGSLWIIGWAIMSLIRVAP